MKIFVLTTELTEKNGWGRYSLDVINSLKKQGVNSVVAVDKGGDRGEIVCLPSTSNYYKNYLTSFWYAWKLRKLAKDCDAIHSFVEKYSLIAYFLSKLTGKKYIVTTHGTYGFVPYRMSLFIKKIHHISLKSAHTVICISNYTKKLLEEKGLSNLVVINNGITYNQFSSDPVSFNERSDTILSVGALKHRKGQHIGLDAFSQISKTFPSLQYIFVGNVDDKKYYKSLQKSASEYGVGDRVSFLSGISDSELLGLYRSSKLFVMTSITKGSHFEGFGLVYLEANANGLPVIGATGSGVEDAIEDGKTGFLVPQNDVEKTSEAIRKLLSNEQLWSLMSRKAQKWAENHDWSRIIGEYVRIYSL